MQAHRPDRVVSILTTLVSIAYFVLWAGAVVVLVAAPAAKLFAGGNPNWVWGLKVPVTALDSAATVHTTWGAAQLVIQDARADLRVPIAMLPWWLITVLWMHAAAAFTLVLLSLRQLRRIFQRVREGAPFDEHNARRMRWLGLLLLALALFNGVAEFVTSLAVRNGLVSSDLAVATGLRINLFVVFVAFVLVALAEIFRRGAELEHEQSLVI
jgi:hypothetical protein